MLVMRKDLTVKGSLQEIQNERCSLFNMILPVEV